MLGSYMTSRGRVGVNRRQRLTIRASDCLSLKSSVLCAWLVVSSIHSHGNDADVGGTFHLTTDISFNIHHNRTCAHKPKNAPRPLSTQLHPLNLFGGDATPYEFLHAVVSCGVRPWFDAFVGPWG